MALLSRPDPLLQEHGVTALLNLSLREKQGRRRGRRRGRPAGARAQVGRVPGGARERGLRAAPPGAAGRVSGGGHRARGAVPVLVSLLESGGARGKKDAATALYALCSGAPEENGPRAVEAGRCARCWS